jgi:acyl-coenzyme A thioesterase PaaI-like protein
VIFQPEHVGYRNRIHGGVISGVLDEAMGWVCYVHSNNFYYTVELTVSYLKPVSPRESFQVLASLDKLKRGFGFTVAVLLDIHGDVVAKASGKFCEVHPDDYEDIYSILDTD